MTDQVVYLNHEPIHHQIGEPGSRNNGSAYCTDCVIAMIYRHETGKTISAEQARHAAAPDKPPTRGLNALEALHGLQALGIHGYSIHINPHAGDAMRATDEGIVLFGEGYGGHPSPHEAEVGGRTDLGFTGPHADSLWGRRNWRKPGTNHPAGEPFTPGWRVWGRDPDHHWGGPPPYDRYRSSYLVRAMDALIGNEGWQVRMMIARTPSRLVLPKSELREFDALAELHIAPLLPSIDLDLLPDFGAGQKATSQGG